MRTKFVAMEQTKNFAWPVTAISKENYQAIVGWAEENKGKIENKHILIFGAGIRGAEISVILESIGYTDIIFTDNNSDKWGGCIDKYPIIPVKDALDMKDKVVYLVSVEEGASICRQLEREGLKHDVDFYFPKPNLYERFINEYKRNIDKEILVMGDCMFEVVSFEDENKDSLADMLYEKYGLENIKLLTMHGLSLPGFYHMLKGQINCSMIPSIVVLMLNFETLTGKQHLLPRSQHTQLIKAAYDYSPDPDGELEKYVMITEQRVKNIQAEFFTTNKFSAKKSNNEQGKISDTASKVFFKINYLYTLDTEIESIQYLKKIMNLAHEYKFHLIPFVPPVNYQRGSELFGENRFESSYGDNLAKLSEVVKNGGFELLDLSHICDNTEFAHTTTPDETTNCLGRKKIIEHISEAIREVKG